MEFDKFIQSLGQKLNLRIDPDKSLDMVDRFADVVKTWREFVSEYKADLSSGSDGSEAHETGAFMQDIV